MALTEQGSTAVLASVDAYGRALIARFGTDTAELAGPQHMYSAQPASLLRYALSLFTPLLGRGIMKEKWTPCCVLVQELVS